VVFKNWLGFASFFTSKIVVVVKPKLFEKLKIHSFEYSFPQMNNYNKILPYFVFNFYKQIASSKSSSMTPLGFLYL